jgi:hypothetical protein
LDVKSLKFGKMYPLGNSDTSYPPRFWTVTADGIPVRHFGDKETERYATDPEYRASIVSRSL